MKGQIPWVRVLAQGAVIVVSILLALGVEAWWAEGQERREEQETLNGLEADFAANLTQLEEVIRIHDWARAAFAELQDMPANEVAALSSDSTGQYVRAFRAARSFDARDGTLDAVISSGRLGILTDTRLRNLLVEWKGRVEDAAEEARAITDRSTGVALRNVRLGGPWRQRDGVVAPMAGVTEVTLELPIADLTLLLADAELMGLVRLKIVTASRYLRELRPLAELARRVQALIKEGQK